MGGNRSGKTTGAIAEDVFWLTGNHPYREVPAPPIRGRIVAVDIEDGIKKIALPELAKWTPRSSLINDSWEDSYDKAARTLTLNNGSFVELMSYEQDVEKFAGVSRHFVHFDEEPPKDIYDECLMRLVDTDGSYWIAMTPLVELTWIQKAIYDPWKAGDNSIFVLLVNTEENPYISVEALDRLTRGLTEEERSARRAGTFVSHTGIIYSGSFSAQDFKEGGNVVPDILNFRFKEYIEGWGHFVCMDHGLVNPTVFLFCCFNGDNDTIIYDELYIHEGKRLVRDNALQYLQRLETLNLKPLYCVGDPSIQNRNAITGTSVQSEYQEHGVGIALGYNDVSAGIARTQNRFAQRKLFVSERCEWTLKEIANYRWDKFSSSKMMSRRNKKETPLKKDDHCMDALRYGVMSRPVLEGEQLLPVGNILNVAVAGPIEMDYELCFSSPQNSFDEVLGIEW